MRGIMRHYLVFCWAGLAAAHGHIKEYIIDGNTYPSFDPALDYDPKWNAKRIEWGFPKARGAVGPIDSVTSLDITCRYHPLQEPAIEAIARAGSNITFNWLDWFQSHKGPLLTYMGSLPPSGKPEDVEFFKIDEATYDPKTMTWGTDWLMQNKNSRTVTIPRDIKPGTYVVRHEIISLHNALNDDYIKKSSGAQFYPQCIKIKVTGDGTATPPGSKFPGTYKWDDKGILINIFYRPNEYLSPGPAVYKSSVVGSPRGPKPVVTETGALPGQQGTAYQEQRVNGDTRWNGAVHGTDAAHPGGGGCIWEAGADPKTAKCTSMNTKDDRYRGFAQPTQSPAYVDQAHTDRSIVKFGPIIKYLFDPTKPRMEERAKQSGKIAAVFEG